MRIQRTSDRWRIWIFLTNTFHNLPVICPFVLTSCSFKLSVISFFRSLNLFCSLSRLLSRAHSTWWVIAFLPNVHTVAQWALCYTTFSDIYGISIPPSLYSRYVFAHTVRFNLSALLQINPLPFYCHPYISGIRKSISLHMGTVGHKSTLESGFLSFSLMSYLSLASFPTFSFSCQDLKPRGEDGVYKELER